MAPNLLITGLPGIGKTTLVLRALERLPTGTASGFITRELRRDARRVGFASESLAGGSCVLAHVDIRSPFRVGRYRVDLFSFEELALPTIDPTKVETPLIIIDEIGKMECISAQFRRLVVAAIQSDRAVLATAALRGDSFVERLKIHPEVTLLHITQQNRDELVRHVTDWALESTAHV